MREEGGGEERENWMGGGGVERCGVGERRQKERDRQGQSQRQRLIEKKGWREVHRCKLSANVILWRQTHTHTHRHTHTHTDTHTHTYTHKQIDRQTDRQTNRDRETETQRQRQRERQRENWMGGGGGASRWKVEKLKEREMGERQGGRGGGGGGSGKRGMERRETERRENFLLQGQLSVLTLISVSVPSPCYRSINDTRYERIQLLIQNRMPMCAVSLLENRE